MTFASAAAGRRGLIPEPPAAREWPSVERLPKQLDPAIEQLVGGV